MKTQTTTWSLRESRSIGGRFVSHTASQPASQPTKTENGGDRTEAGGRHVGLLGVLADGQVVVETELAVAVIADPVASSGMMVLLAKQVHLQNSSDEVVAGAAAAATAVELDSGNARRRYRIIGAGENMAR